MVTIRIVGMKEATGAIRAAISRGADNALRVAAARGEQLVKQNIASPYSGRPPAVATGNLINSVNFEISRETPISRAVVFAGPPADVYADPVETGSRPHFPPPSALLLWVKKKFGAASEKQALSIAFAVARNIAKRGVAPFLMFARGLEVLKAELPGIFEAQIGKAIESASAAQAQPGDTA